MSLKAICLSVKSKVNVLLFAGFCVAAVSLSSGLAFAQTGTYSFTQSRASSQDIARWEEMAQNITIYRDDWGIAHVYAKTNEGAVFGMEYAQAEDNFLRVETNFLKRLGLTAMANGKRAMYKDLRRRLFINFDSAKVMYKSSPQWLKNVMNAYADGLNYYLYTHPEVHPKVIKHYEPWMIMTFTEGSIGGDIYHVSSRDIAKFYGGEPLAKVAPDPNSFMPPVPVWGSNGIAISPKNTLNGHAMMLINPHLTFYYRDELHMVSEEGLNAYGQVTWGQPFIYQGFNTHDGWMHTSSGVVNISYYLESVSKKNGRYYYKYGDKQLPVKSRPITIKYKTSTGMKSKTFTAYYTQHGPVVGKTEGKWKTCNLMNMHAKLHKKALIQDWKRMFTTGYKSFNETMELHTNSSNNTIFADANGDIAYWHSDWIPKRSDKFDWTRPVNGSNPETDIDGILSLDETPKLLNPGSGWLYNSNNWPWSAAGRYSPERKNFPGYVDGALHESPRGYHALKLLTNKKNWTIASLAAAAYDSYLPPFARMIPTLVAAYDYLPASNPLKAKLNRQIVVLQGWDYRWGINSVATSLAIFWGRQLYRQMRKQSVNFRKYAVTDYVAEIAKPEQLLKALTKASDKLTKEFGSWETPWGNINRYQRLKNVISPHHFSDSKPSIGVPMTSSRWGSLASFDARPYPGTKKWYGNTGNSWVCVVEFGDKVKARAVKVGGISGDPDSPHFRDQQVRYTYGNFRNVYYYKTDLMKHVEETYHPGK